jgi:hypothetical protein
MNASPENLATEVVTPREADTRAVQASPVRAVLTHSATLVSPSTYC